MDDGRATFPVLGIDDDVAFHAVLLVAVGWVVGVGGFGKGDNRIGRVIVNQNQITSIDASDFAPFIVNHGF